MRTKIFSRAIVIVMTLLISGCSAFSFIFERLDWFTLWRLDKMFDLSEEQEDQIRPDIVAIQEWMRTEGFPITIEKLEVLKTMWEADKPEQAYEYLMSSMQNLNSMYLNAMKQGVVNFSMLLNEENAQHYREYSNEEQEDWFDSARSVDARIEHETERLEEWFGHLNDKQVTLIENWASISENELQTRIDNHVNWREAFLHLSLKQNGLMIQTWLDDLSIFWTPEYRFLKQHNDQQRQALVFDLLPTLSPKQKRHASEHVKGWIEKLEDVLPED